jgi:hypothetical protein
MMLKPSKNTYIFLYLRFYHKSAILRIYSLFF